MNHRLLLLVSFIFIPNSFAHAQGIRMCEPEVIRQSLAASRIFSEWIMAPDLMNAHNLFPIPEKAVSKLKFERGDVISIFPSLEEEYGCAYAQGYWVRELHDDGDVGVFRAPFLLVQKDGNLVTLMAPTSDGDPSFSELDKNIINIIAGFHVSKDILSLIEIDGDAHDDFQSFVQIFRKAN